MHAFEVLGDPVRRHLVELLAEGERTAGELTDTARRRFGISQPAVSKHLRVLRESGFATSAVAGPRRVYRLRAEPLRELDAWLARYRALWGQRLDALAVEIHRGNRSGGGREEP